MRDRWLILNFDRQEYLNPLDLGERLPLGCVNSSLTGFALMTFLARDDGQGSGDLHANEVGFMNEPVSGRWAGQRLAIFSAGGTPGEARFKHLGMAPPPNLTPYDWALSKESKYQGIGRELERLYTRYFAETLHYSRIDTLGGPLEWVPPRLLQRVTSPDTPRFQQWQDGRHRMAGRLANSIARAMGG